MPEGRRGRARIGSTYAAKSLHAQDDAPRRGVAPESNGSRSKTMVTPARASYGWSSISTPHCPGVRCRGHAIGNYVVDFSQRDAVQCSPRRKIVIELDGSQHLDQAEYDLGRTKYLEAKGYRVLRFWNNDVMNDIEIVLNTIWNEINKVP